MIPDSYQRLADKLGIPDPDAFAEPLSWRHVQAECRNCGRPIFTKQEVSSRANRQDPWRHTDTAQQGCIAL